MELSVWRVVLEVGGGDKNNVQDAVKGLFLSLHPLSKMRDFQAT